MDTTEKDRESKITDEGFWENEPRLEETVGYPGEDWTAAEPEHAEELVPVEAEGSVIVPYEEVEDTSVAPKKKKFKVGKVHIIIASIIATILVIAAVALTVFNWMKDSKIKDDPEETPMAVMFLADEGQSYLGDLYTVALNGEKTKVASDVNRYGFEVFGDNNLVYLSSGNLYLKKYGMSPEKITSDAYAYGYKISANGNAILYVTGEQGDIYLYYLDGTKEKIGTGVCTEGSFYSVSADGKNVFYTDMDGNFYCWTAESGKEKIASNVFGSVILKNDAFYYETYNKSTEKSITYIKLANETDAQKIDHINMSSVQIAPGGLFALYLDDCSYEDGYRGELYLYIKNGDPIKLASDVSEYSVTEDAKYVYIRDKDGMFYVKEIPDVGEKTYEKYSKFRDKLDENKRIKLASDVISYKISPNGRNVAILDAQKDLYISIDGEKSVKVSADVKDYMISNTRLCFLTGDNKLYLNSRVEKTDVIKENNKLIAVNIKNFAHSRYGKYITFYDSQTNALNICIDGKTPKTLVTEANTYDYIYYKNKVTYENIIEIDDFVGKYKNDELGYLFEIRKDGEKFKVDWWISGNINTIDMYTYGAIDRYSLGGSARFDRDHYIERFVEKDGIKRFGHNNMNYVMTRLTDEEFQAEIEKQRTVENQKEATETRREALREKVKALEEKGSKYYRQGVDVTTTTPLYSDHDRKYLLDDVNYDEDTHLSVRTYYVSADGTTLWLGLYGRYRGDYVWIIAK